MNEDENEQNREIHVLHLPARRFHENPNFRIHVLAFVVGIGAAIAAYLFKLSIIGFEKLREIIHDFLSTTGIPTYVATLLLPMLAGLITGPIISKWAKEAKGHGVPEVIEAVELKQGVIRLRVPFIKAGVSSISIGSGLSLGSEGPIVQIAGGLASYLGQKAKLKTEDIKMLVVCGVASGISGIFNAPLGGVLFGLEAIYGAFSIFSFLPVLFSSLIATTITNILLKSQSLLHVPTYTYDIKEIWLFIIVGILAGFGGVIYQRALYFMEGFFDNIVKAPLGLKIGGAGLLVGTIGIWFPQALGVGYEQITDFLSANTNETSLGWQSLLVVGIILFIMKLLTTVLSIGSGASGGIFAPGLFLGAAIGASFGSLCHYIAPNLQTPIGTFALIGLGALFAGVARVPFTMIVMTGELTGDYYVMLPVILAVSISFWINHGINEYSIYTQKLANKGIVVRKQLIDELLIHMPVVDTMTKDVIAISDKTTIKEASEIAQVYRYTGYPIINEKHQYEGIITIDDMRKAHILGKDYESVTKHAFCSKDIYCTPFNTLKEALDLMYAKRISRLAVVKPENKELVGIITRNDIINVIESQNLLVAQQRAKSEALEIKETFIDEEELRKFPLRSKIIRLHTEIKEH